MNTLKNRIFQVSRKAMVVAVACGVLAACGSDDDEDTYVARDVEVLYNLAADRMELKQWALAATLFDEVERQHPYSPWARRAQLMAAYVYYRDKEYEGAILSAERYLSLHPGSSLAPYAYYLIALSYYSQISEVGRDQRVTQQAADALQEVYQRFPDTQYARDARLKFDLTQDMLAASEMKVGRFYLERDQHVAAIGRFRTVVDEFPTTSHTPEALFRMVEGYLILGVVPEAKRITAVLGYNYPDSKWYRFAYELVEDDLTDEDIAGGAQ